MVRFNPFFRPLQATSFFSRRGISRVSVIAIVLLALICGTLGFGLGVNHHGAQSAQAQMKISPQAQGLNDAFVNVADFVKPQVVRLEVEQAPAKESGNDPLSPFRPFMPDLPQSPPVPREGLGSGVIIDAAGYILTNVHVVSNATDIKVLTNDGERYSGKVLGTDKETDLAVVKIDPKLGKPLIPARLGNADDAKVGSWVMAVGSPFGFDASVTVGVVSGKSRSLPNQENPDSRYRNLIQTDAAINPGNSGGPLVNLEGEVIGINQAIFSPGPYAGNVGLGFAIPINDYTRKIIASLKQGQAFVRGRLGAYVRDLDPGMAGIYGAKKGAFVEQIIKNSPAAAAGIQEEDIITAVNGTPIESSDQLVDVIQRTNPGQSVSITLLRGGKEKTVTAKITAKEETQAAAPETPELAKTDRLGLRVGELTPEIAQKLRVPVQQGVVIMAINPAGAAARVGLAAGDIIIKVNLSPIRNVAEFQSITAKLKAGQPATIRFRRGDNTHTVVIEEMPE